MQNNIQPKYVSFEIAEWLSEKGFDVPCRYIYNIVGGIEDWIEYADDFRYFNNSKWKSSPYYSAPEQWQVMEWLRINHGIWIVVNIGIPHGQGIMYYSNVIKFGLHHKNKYRSAFFNSPQEAYNAAFDYIKDNNLV